MGYLSISGTGYDEQAMRRAGYTKVGSRSDTGVGAGFDRYLPTPKQDPAEMAMSTLKSAADKFMQEWQGEVANLKGYYKTGFGAANEIEGMADTYAQELESYKQKFTPLQDSLLGMAQDDLGRRNTLAGDFMTYARPDYEAVSGRAMADVAHQSEIGRQAADRALAGMGGRTDANRYMQTQMRSRIDEAANKALAANQARQMETMRAAQLAGQGIQLFDPNQGAQGALAIQAGQNPYLAGQSQALQAGGALRSDLINSYGNNIVLPAGEAAGALYGAVNGIAYGSGAGSGGSGGGSRTTYGGVISGMNSNYNQEAIDFFAPKTTSYADSSGGYTTDSSGNFQWRGPLPDPNGPGTITM